MDAQLNSASNKYPLFILLIDPQRDKLEIHGKNVFQETYFFHVFPVYLIAGLSKVCREGTCWMRNLILHPTSAYT
jgi:hypothetical protein